MSNWLFGVATLGLLVLGSVQAEAGRLRGPASKVFLVQGFRTSSLKVQFAANKPAVVQVIGDGDAPLAVAVYAPDGKRVAVDTRHTDRFVLRWLARTTQPYRVKVENRGGVPVRFRLSSN